MLAEDSEYFDELTPERKNQVIGMRDFVKQSANSSGLEWKGRMQKEINFHVFNTDFPQALVMNHFQITQYTRLINSPYKRVPVDVDSFPFIAINFQLTTAYIKKFRISIPTVIKVIIVSMKLNNSNTRGGGVFGKMKAKAGFLRQVLRTIKELAWYR